MVTMEAAKQLASRYLKGLPDAATYDYVIIDERTMEKEYVWIFFYQSREFVEYGNMNEMLYGNGPIMVDKIDGSLHQLGTAFPGEQIAEYEAKKKLQS